MNLFEAVQSQRKTMFARVKMSAEEEIHRSVYASVVRAEKCNKEAVNKIHFQVNNTFVFSRC